MRLTRFGLVAVLLAIICLQHTIGSGIHPKTHDRTQMIQRTHRIHSRAYGQPNMRHFKAMMADDNKKDSDDDKDTSSSDDSDKEKYSDKEQLTALMLALFLGFFGAGRFYINNPFYGTCKLIFSFIIYLLLCSVARDIHVFVKSETRRYDEEMGQEVDD